MELRNWLLCFGCAPEELRVVVARLDDWMANSSPPWAGYRALMACRLIALDKRPRVCPVGIGETLHQALAKLVMRAAGEQAKTACGNLQLCAGLEAGIEGATHAVGQSKRERVRARRGEEEGEDEEETDEPAEEGDEVVSCLGRVVVARLDDWMANSSPPWAGYRALMACRLIALDKRPRVCPVGIGETLHQALAKLVMRAAGEQAKTACGNLQLCAGLEAGIEGATHAVGQSKRERVRARRGEEEGEDEEETDEPAEEGDEVVSCLGN